MGLSWPQMCKAHKATGHRGPLQISLPLKIYCYALYQLTGSWGRSALLGADKNLPWGPRLYWETQRCHLAQGGAVALEGGRREERREGEGFLEQEWCLCWPWRPGWTLQERHIRPGDGKHSRLVGDHRATLCATQQAV